MDDYLFGLLSVFGYGLFTTVQPCPLAANLAALSYLCGQARGLPRLLAAGLALVLGQVCVYIALAAILSLVGSKTLVYRHLSAIGGLLLGPALVLAGMLILGILPKPWRGASTRVDVWRVRFGASTIGAFLLGALIAIGFCPSTGAIFFFLLVPTALRHDSPFLYPAVYGLGAGLPLLACAGLVTAGVNLAARLRERHAPVLLLRRIAGVILIVLGVFSSLVFLFSAA